MSPVRRIAAIAREAFAAAVSSPVASLATIVMVAGLCTAVLLTTGRTVAAENSVLGSIDRVGTRTVVVRAQPGAGLTNEILDRLANIDGIEWAGGFGPAEDVINTAIPEGVRVGARSAFSSNLPRLGVPSRLPLPGVNAWATPDALTQLGMVDRTGSVTTLAGSNYVVSGPIVLPEWLSFLGSTVVIPQSTGPPSELAVVVVVAKRPDLVVPVARLVQSVLGVEDPSQIELTTSEEVASLRAIVQGQFGDYGRSLVLVVLAVSGFLVGSILTGLIMMRRKDFGRRRALGATRGLILSVLLAQTFGLASVGAILGSGVANAMLLLDGNTLPGFAFTAAICILAVTVALLAATIPAIVAARRDPIRELRVP